MLFAILCSFSFPFFLMAIIIFQTASLSSFLGAVIGRSFLLLDLSYVLFSISALLRIYFLFVRCTLYSPAARYPGSIHRRTCGVPACTRAAKSHGLCKRHYDKDYHSVYYLDLDHKASRAVSNKQWKLAHRAEINARRRERYAEDPERHRAEVKAYREAHPDKVRVASPLFKAGSCKAVSRASDNGRLQVVQTMDFNSPF